jgi:Bacterial mobilisation protein (MobC)
MARPKQSLIRDQKLSVRLTAEELIALRERAAKAQLTLTDFVRLQALVKRRKSRQTAKTANRHPLELLEPARFHELRRIGVNLNQIARHCNRYQVPPPAGVEQLVSDLLAILNRSGPAP